MAEAQYSHNNIIDPKTGFLENPAYPYAFNAAKKQAFIDCLVENGLGLYEACDAMGIKRETLNKHYQNDPVFKQALDEARTQYGARLESVSKKNALRDRSVIERIFQLKSIFPEKYGDKRDAGNMSVSISIDGKAIENILKREKVIDAELVSQDQIEDKK